MTVADTPRIFGWEYLVVRYEADADALREVLPDQVEPIAGAAIGFEWRRTLAPAGEGERIDASVVVPCRYRGRELGYELRHYCDQLRPARIKAGTACDGGPDFYAKLLSSPQLRTGTLHDGETLVAAAILSRGASASAEGEAEAAHWMALPRLNAAGLDAERPPRAPAEDGLPTFERRGEIVFQLKQAPSGAVIAPAVRRVLHGHFFVGAPGDHQSVSLVTRS
jgi:hypothetical protein